MKFGFALPGRGPLASADSLVRIANKGEELGYDAVLMGDHILVPKKIDSIYPYTPTGEFPGEGAGDAMEMITLLAYVAGQTKKIRLVTSVLIVPYRPVLLAAKALATLDVLSGGRLVVGIGVGWMEEEFQAMGLDTYKERGAVTDEYLQLYKELWTSENPSFDGKYYQISGSGFEPKPAQKPHPPIWIGGHTGPAIRRAAKYGDGWMPIGLRPPAILDPEELGGKIAQLRKLTVEAGRPEDAVDLTFSTSVVFNDSIGSSREMMQGQPEQIAGDRRQYQDLGVSNFIIGLQGNTVPELQENMERFSREVMTLIPD